MLKAVQSLDKKWKELVYSASGFGPNFLMVLMGAYFSDAVNPAGLGADVNGQTIVGTICLVIPALFSVLMIVAKVFDGLIDIPFASITDNLSTKWGRRRPPILVCFIPMVISFAFCWWPVFGTAESAQIGNTIWFIFWALIFFATYTMCLIAFYGSLSNVCSSASQRLRVSAFKSFFDTISYCVVYALVPVILQGLYNSSDGALGIDEFVFMCLPLMFTMVIPLFMIKEGKKYGYPENEGFEKQPKIRLGQSFKITFKNKIFGNWLVVNCCSFFGLQMFLVAMNAMIIGGMGMDGVGMTILNTCAFAPVPIMLYLFRKLAAKKGLRFTYQTCLISFAVAILGFFFGSTFICGDNRLAQYLIGCIGGVIGSWAIGAFFMMPYMVPAQISSVEEKLLKKNHSAMYFAAQAFATSVVGAIASYGIYDILKNIFVSGDFRFVWAEATELLSAEKVAESLLGTGTVYNFGVMIVPFIVAVLCVVGFLFAFRMPRDYSPAEVAKSFKKMYPDLDISEYENVTHEKEEKGEILFVQIALSVLSGFLFGFIWYGMLLSSVKKLTGKGKRALFWELGWNGPLLWALGCFIPFFGIYAMLLLNKALAEKAAERGIALGGRKVLSVVFGILLPLSFLNIVSLSLLQKDVNKFYAAEESQAAAEELPVSKNEAAV